MVIGSRGRSMLLYKRIAMALQWLQNTWPRIRLQRLHASAAAVRDCQNAARPGVKSLCYRRVEQRRPKWQPVTHSRTRESYLSRTLTSNLTRELRWEKFKVMSIYPMNLTLFVCGMLLAFSRGGEPHKSALFKGVALSLQNCRFIAWWQSRAGHVLSHLSS